MFARGARWHSVFLDQFLGLLLCHSDFVFVSSRCLNFLMLMRFHAFFQVFVAIPTLKNL